MATIELNIDDQTFARARRVAESWQTSVEAICTEIVERIASAPETPPMPLSSMIDRYGRPIDEPTLARARRHAEAAQTSVESALDLILAGSGPPRPRVPGTVSHDPLRGLLADEPELADAIMESAYDFRAQPLRLPPGE